MCLKTFLKYTSLIFSFVAINCKDKWTEECFVKSLLICALKQNTSIEMDVNTDFIGNRLVSNVKITITIHESFVLLFKWINMIATFDYPQNR